MEIKFITLSGNALLILFSERIGVGLMVGLFAALMIWVFDYIKNTDNRKVQREKDKIEKEDEVTFNKLNLKRESLLDLKTKGIISEEEFKSKTDFINTEAFEEWVKGSYEYKQLKKLYEEGVFSKDEFEEKLVILKDKAKEKELDIDTKQNTEPSLYQRILNESNEINKELKTDNISSHQLYGKWITNESKFYLKQSGEYHIIFNNGTSFKGNWELDKRNNINFKKMFKMKIYKLGTHIIRLSNNRYAARIE